MPKLKNRISTEGLRQRFGAVKRHWATRAAGALLALLVVAPGVLYLAPALGGADAAYNVLSGSMEPFFAPGDVIFVEHVDPTTLQAGDVVTFRPSAGSDVLVTHRVVEVLTEGGHVRYITKGDANEDVDPMVMQPSMVEGRYRYHIPAWGLLLGFLQSKAGYVALVLVPGTLVILHEGVILYRELDRLDRARASKTAAAAGAPAPKEEHVLP